MRGGRTRGSALAAAAAALLAVACGDGPAAPDTAPLEVLAAGGGGQYGAPGQRLAEPLRVLVRRADTQVPQEGVVVGWSVEAGDASLVTTAVGTSDPQGIASATVQLGTTPGPVRVRAQVRDQAAASVAFDLWVAVRPVLTSLGASTARAGDTLRITGSGFSPDPGRNVVLFSGIRGRVVAAAAGELRVEVPSCLATRNVVVTAQLGSLASQPRPLSVVAGAPGTTPWEAGVPVDVADPAGYACLRLPAGRRYLVVVHSAGTVGAARHGFSLAGLSDPAAAPGPSGTADRPAASDPTGSAGLRFESALRRSEGRLVRGGGAVGGADRPVHAAAEGVAPSVGSRRSFRVLNAQGRFDDVQAVARLVSREAVLYVDETAPGGGFTEAELRAYAATFDDLIHPTVTGAFGRPSDLDANERVVVLFTPRVNRLTPRGSDGFVGGFFYGLDLLDRDGSNRGEIFYALVPDSAGQYSDPRPREVVLRVTPAILAHEFQHMVHFNQRVLELGAKGTEALWLSEGLAQMAEELVAREVEKTGAPGEAEAYRSGNRIRARRFLADPSAVSLLVTLGQGTLEERGAAWLHTLYLWDAHGGGEALRRMTRSTLTGTANVEAVAGKAWAPLLADWEAALYADGLGGRYSFEYPGISLRGLLGGGHGPYPLSPETLGTTDFTRSGSLWSSSARHYIVIPPSGGSVVLRLGGEAGGDASPDAALGLRVVPLFP